MVSEATRLFFVFQDRENRNLSQSPARKLYWACANAYKGGYILFAFKGTVFALFIEKSYAL